MLADELAGMGSVRLIDSSPQILPNGSSRERSSVQSVLQSKGVSFLGGKRVSDITCENPEEGYTVTFSGSDMHSSTADLVFWTCGNYRNKVPFSTLSNAGDDELLAESTLALKGFPNVFAVGDMVSYSALKGNGLKPSFWALLSTHTKCT